MRKWNSSSSGHVYIIIIIYIYIYNQANDVGCKFGLAAVGPVQQKCRSNLWPPSFRMVVQIQKPLRAVDSLKKISFRRWL